MLILGNNKDSTQASAYASYLHTLFKRIVVADHEESKDFKDLKQQIPYKFAFVQHEITDHDYLNSKNFLRDLGEVFDIAIMPEVLCHLTSLISLERLLVTISDKLKYLIVVHRFKKPEDEKVDKKSKEYDLKYLSVSEIKKAAEAASYKFLHEIVIDSHVCLVLCSK